MNIGHLFPGSFGSDCGCCQVGGPLSDVNGAVYGCKEREGVFTHREETVLGRIRETALRVRALKAKLRDVERSAGGDSEAARAITAEIEALRKLRGELELERIAAAEERMRLLGHL